MFSWAIVMTVCTLGNTPDAQCDDYVLDMLRTPAECTVQLAERTATIMRKHPEAVSLTCERAKVQ